MIEDTIRKIEETLRGGDVAPARKKELLRLLAELKAELRALSATRRDEAREIARLAHAAHEEALAGKPAGKPAAKPSGKKAPPTKSAADRFTESVRGFETSHPKLTAVVESIAETLASAGM